MKVFETLHVQLKAAKRTVRSEAAMTKSVKMAAFRVVALRGIVEV
jgi:hypothetical protein